MQSRYPPIQTIDKIVTFTKNSNSLVPKDAPEPNPLFSTLNLHIPERGFILGQNLVGTNTYRPQWGFARAEPNFAEEPTRLLETSKT